MRLLYNHKSTKALIIPLRFTPLKQVVVIPDQPSLTLPQERHQDIEYQLRIGTKSRGWDYDFRDYKHMPRKNIGDVKVLYGDEILNFPESNLLGADVEIPTSILKTLGGEGQIYVEVRTSMKGSDAFIWPSNEVAIQIWDPMSRSN